MDFGLNCDRSNITVNSDEVLEAIKTLDKNKSCGMDGIFAEHLKYANRRLYYLMSLCFTSMFSHGYLPEGLIRVVLVPLVKNKNSSICTKSNYRPIALASILSKVLEKVIYKRIQQFLECQSNQFGYKKYHNTILTSDTFMIYFSQYSSQ